MKEKIKQSLFFLFGSLFFLLGFIGIFLPLLPTTPFMILSAGCFANSSRRFHQMLLNNRWFGEELRQWEKNKTMKRSTKIKGTVIIVLTFSITILILWNNSLHQVLLILLAVILLFFVWRVPEQKLTERKVTQQKVTQQK